MGKENANPVRILRLEQLHELNDDWAKTVYRYTSEFRRIKDGLRGLKKEIGTLQNAFLDDRHGHPYKLTEPVQAWLSEFCTSHPQIASSRVQSELQSRFGVAVSVSQINRVRAKLGVTKQGRGRALAQGEKN